MLRDAVEHGTLAAAWAACAGPEAGRRQYADGDDYFPRYLCSMYLAP
jgi:hypothetical protein